MDEYFTCGAEHCPYNSDGYCLSDVMQNSGLCYEDYIEEMEKQGA